jgi:hypothetical protein
MKISGAERINQVLLAPLYLPFASYEITQFPESRCAKNGGCRDVGALLDEPRSTEPVEKRHGRRAVSAEFHK